MRLLKNPFKLLLIFCLVLMVGLSFLSSTALAQTKQPSPPTTLKQDDLNRVILMRDLLHEGAITLACQLQGVERTSPTMDCTAPGFTATGHKPGGLLVLASNAIGMMYTPVADGTSYVNRLAGNFGIAKTAHAQETGSPSGPGGGFGSLSQVQDIFVLSRDMAYLILVLIFVIIGIAIMLRIHIDPRTIMTIQNQIPKIIIAIVLITFSYAIVGFLIDIMWVGTYVGINVVTARQADCRTPNDQDKPNQVGPFSLGGQDKLPLSGAATVGILNNPIAYTTDLFGDKTGCFGSFDGISGLSWTVGGTLSSIFVRTALGFIGIDESITCSIKDFDLGNCFKATVFQLFQFLGQILGFLIIFFAILIALIRVWFILLKAYVYLMIDVMFAPFWILLSVLPGSSLTFNQWLRNIIAQLAVFPTTAVLLVIAAVVAYNPRLADPTSGVFLPPLIGNPNISDNLGALTALGFIMLTPEVSNMIRDALKAPAMKYGSAVGQNVKKGNPLAVWGTVGTFGYQWSGAKNVPLINKLPGLKTTQHGPAQGGGGGGHGP